MNQGYEWEYVRTRDVVCTGNRDIVVIRRLCDNHVRLGMMNKYMMPIFLLEPFDDEKHAEVDQSDRIAFVVAGAHLFEGVRCEVLTNYTNMCRNRISLCGSLVELFGFRQCNEREIVIVRQNKPVKTVVLKESKTEAQPEVETVQEWLDVTNEEATEPEPEPEQKAEEPEAEAELPLLREMQIGQFTKVRVTEVIKHEDGSYYTFKATDRSGESAVGYTIFGSEASTLMGKELSLLRNEHGFFIVSVPHDYVNTRMFVRGVDGGRFVTNMIMTSVKVISMDKCTYYVRFNSISGEEQCWFYAGTTMNHGGMKKLEIDGTVCIPVAHDDFKLPQPLINRIDGLTGSTCKIAISDISMECAMSNLQNNKLPHVNPRDKSPWSDDRGIVVRMNSNGEMDMFRPNPRRIATFRTSIHDLVHLGVTTPSLDEVAVFAMRNLRIAERTKFCKVEILGFNGVWLVLTRKPSNDDEEQILVDNKWDNLPTNSHMDAWLHEWNDNANAANPRINSFDAICSNGERVRGHFVSDGKFGSNIRLSVTKAKTEKFRIAEAQMRINSRAYRYDQDGQIIPQNPEMLELRAERHGVAVVDNSRYLFILTMMNLNYTERAYMFAASTFDLATIELPVYVPVVFKGDGSPISPVNDMVEVPGKGKVFLSSVDMESAIKLRDQEAKRTVTGYRPSSVVDLRNGRFGVAGAGNAKFVCTVVGDVAPDSAQVMKYIWDNVKITYGADEFEVEAEALNARLTFKRDSF